VVVPPGGELAPVEPQFTPIYPIPNADAGPRVTIDPEGQRLLPGPGAIDRRFATMPDEQVQALADELTGDIAPDGKPNNRADRLLGQAAAAELDRRAAARESDAKPALPAPPPPPAVDPNAGPLSAAVAAAQAAGVAPGPGSPAVPREAGDGAKNGTSAAGNAGSAPGNGEPGSANAEAAPPPAPPVNPAAGPLSASQRQRTHRSTECRAQHRNPARRA
jgi:hypothetical protein